MQKSQKCKISEKVERAKEKKAKNAKKPKIQNCKKGKNAKSQKIYRGSDKHYLFI